MSHANIAVVGTHCESLTEAQIEEKLEKLKRRVFKAFGNAFRFVVVIPFSFLFSFLLKCRGMPLYYVSSTTGFGVDRLRDYLQETVR